VNLRSDDWRDGSRFAVAVVRAVREAAGDLCVGVRLSADSARAPAIAETVVAEGVDYLSLALGDSSTYRGSVGIVPPPPVDADRIAAAAARFELGVPRILTSRIVDPEEAGRLVAERRADAVGMTRALIADPELPAKARSGSLRGLVRCIGCNACIAHYHAGTAIACAVNSRSGRERSIGPVASAREPRRIVVVGGGPAGIAAASTAAEAGHDVVLFEAARLGGQLVLGDAAIAAAFLDNAERQLANVDVRLGLPATPEAVVALSPDGVVVATGARPYVDPELALDGVEVLQAWDVLSGGLLRACRVVVADWGGDPGGLDAAERLAAAGKEVTLAVASVAVGELVHQYRRNLYLERLYRAGVTILHHVALDSASAGEVRLRNVFARELVVPVAADALVLALGRVPAASPAAELAARGLDVAEAGDCLSPRSLEEAVLEGTLAARRLVA
jgi:NADPH-dependent 2,4-dienoyl-CoA reductase/sulfur reductase-like enzyme